MKIRRSKLKAGAIIFAKKNATFTRFEFKRRYTIKMGQQYRVINDVPEDADNDFLVDLERVGAAHIVKVSLLFVRKLFERRERDYLGWSIEEWNVDEQSGWQIVRLTESGTEIGASYRIRAS